MARRISDSYPPRSKHRAGLVNQAGSKPMAAVHLLLRGGTWRRRSAGGTAGTGTPRASRTHRIGVISEASYVGRLRNHLALHCLEQFRPARGGGQVELRIERIELEHVMVIARAIRCAHAHVGA